MFFTVSPFHRTASVQGWFPPHCTALLNCCLITAHMGTVCVSTSISELLTYLHFGWCSAPTAGPDIHSSQWSSGNAPVEGKQRWMTGINKVFWQFFDRNNFLVSPSLQKCWSSYKHVLGKSHSRPWTGCQSNTYNTNYINTYGKIRRQVYCACLWTVEYRSTQEETDTRRKSQQCTWSTWNRWTTTAQLPHYVQILRSFWASSVFK